VYLSFIFLIPFIGVGPCNPPLLCHKSGFIAFETYQAIKLTIFNDQQLQNLLKFCQLLMYINQH